MKRAPVAGRRPPGSPRDPSITEITRQVAARYELTAGDLSSTRKERRATRPRHIAMWLARALTRHGATQIGPAFGGRDRSTVAAAWRGLAARMAADPGLKAEVEALRLAILAAGRAPADNDPTLRHLALAAFDRTQISETEVARWRTAAAALYAALEAGGHVDGQELEGGAPRVPTGGPIAAPSDGRRGGGVAARESCERSSWVRLSAEVADGPAPSLCALIAVYCRCCWSRWRSRDGGVPRRTKLTRREQRAGGPDKVLDAATVINPRYGKRGELKWMSLHDRCVLPVDDRRRMRLTTSCRLVCILRTIL